MVLFITVGVVIVGVGTILAFQLTGTDRTETEIINPFESLQDFCASVPPISSDEYLPTARVMGQFYM